MVGWAVGGLNICSKIVYLNVLRAWTGAYHKPLVCFDLVNSMAKFQLHKRIVLIMLAIECFDVPKVDCAVFKQRYHILPASTELCVDEHPSLVC